jgi:hypothetical protein
MRLSPQEPKRRYGLQGISIQGLRHDKTKRQEETQNSPSFDPLAIAMMGIKDGIRKATNAEQAKSSTHISLDRWGLRTKEERRNNGICTPFIQLIMGRAKVGIREARCPNQTH